MTPEQTAAAETVTAELQAYSDQLVPGAAEAMGQRWFNVGSMPPEQRAAEIARRVASPMADQWRSPGYDPKTAPTPLERAISQQAHKLRAGAAAELVKEWGPELAGRDPVRMAGEVARRLATPGNVGFLKDQPADPAYVSRLDALIWSNFSDVLDPARVKDLIRDRGREFSRMTEQQVIMLVAGSLRATANREKYGKGVEIQPGDLRLRGVSKDAINGTRVTRIAPETPPRRRMSF